MSDVSSFTRGLTRALERRSKAEQTQRTKTNGDTKTIIKTKLTDDKYKQIITSKMIAHIHKHKEAIL